MTEIGRAPWAVYGLLKLEDAISTTVTPGMILISLIGFTLVYGGLMAVDIYLLAKYARQVPDSEETSEPAIDLEPSLLGAAD